MALEDYLRPDEKLISHHGRLYATSQRLICYVQTHRGEQMHDLPYNRLTGFQVVRRSMHPMMIAGTLVTIGGAYFTLQLGLFFTLLAIPLGIAMVVLGGIGRESHYQLQLHNMTAEEERLWRLDYSRAQSFIATLRTIIPSLEERPD